MRGLQDIYEAYKMSRTVRYGLRGGMMGEAIIAYMVSKEIGDEPKVGALLIESVVTAIETSNSNTVDELSEIGYGMSYLIGNGYLLDEENALEEWDELFESVLTEKYPKMGTTINIGLYFCSRSYELSKGRVKKNLLTCQQSLLELVAAKNSWDKDGMLHYLSFLSELFRLNVFRYRTLDLLIKALAALQLLEEQLTDAERKCYGFCLQPLLENEHVSSFLLKHHQELYELGICMMRSGFAGSALLHEDLPIIELDGRVYLMPTSGQCISLSSL